jgi:predicted KAP-like P-loop ATPase
MDIKPNKFLNALREYHVIDISNEVYNKAELIIFNVLDYVINVTDEQITPLGLTILAINVAKTPDGAFLYY